MYAPDRYGDCSSVPGEESDKKFREKAGYQKHESCEGQAEQQDFFLRLADSIQLAGAVIVTDNSLCSAADAQHGAGDHSHITLDDRNGSNEQVGFVSARFGQDGIQDDEN